MSSFVEVIDHELPEFPDVPTEYIATMVMLDMLNCASAQTQEFIEQEFVGERTPRNDSFRITSWVERPDSKLGHALALARPGYTTRGDVMKEIIRGEFYCVDRENHTIVEGPKNLQIVAGIHHQERVDEILTRFDRGELQTMHAMLGKAAVAFTGGESQIDRDVALALMENSLDELVDIFPERSIPEIAAASSENHPCADANFINSAMRRLEAVNFKKETDVKEIALRALINGTTHYLYLAKFAGEDLARVELAIDSSSPHTSTYEPEKGQDNEREFNCTAETLISIIEGGERIPLAVFHDKMEELMYGEFGMDSDSGRFF